jgi:hypothetical protein
MQGQQPIEEQDESWLDDEARDVEHKWKRMNTKLRVKWLAQIKVKADKEDMSQEKLDKILDEYGLTKFPKEKVWNEVQKIKPKWKKMSTAERTRWIDDLNDIAVKVRTSDADVQSILDDAKLKIKEEVEIDEAKEFWAIIDKAKGGEVMAVSSDEKGAKSSVKMSNFSKHDYHFGKDPRTLKIVKVAGSYKQGEKMIGTKLSFKEEVEITEAVHDKKSTFTMAPFEDLRSVADAALKIMTRQPQEVKEEEKEEVTKEDQPQSLTEEIV